MGYSDQKILIKKWWASRRHKYNKALVGSFSAALIIYNGFLFLGDALFSKPDPDDFFDWQFKMYFVLFQLVISLFMIGVANLLYSLVSYFDQRSDNRNEDTSSQLLFNIGYWGSVSLPLLMSLWLTVDRVLSSLPNILSTQR